MSIGLCWIRRDIRLHDHMALAAATKECDEVYLVFVFDKGILGKLPKEDRRVQFLTEGLMELREELQKQGSDINIVHGDPTAEIPKMAKKLKVEKVYTNRDYEPTAIKRDEKTKKALSELGIEYSDYRDHVLFENDEILNLKGEPYKVFTAYKKAWLAVFEDQFPGRLGSVKVDKKKLAKVRPQKLLRVESQLEKIGFSPTENIMLGGSKEAKKVLRKFSKKISDYHETRDFPAKEGTSNLSPYIRHGMISIRECFQQALESDSKGGQIWLSELIWREFYQMILALFPSVVKKSFKENYEGISWEGKKDWYQKWCDGQTGYPIVDSAMRCLNQTGTMPNRLRMVVASFLCKTLLIDYKKGEEYFALKLLDFDLAANNGGWQWCSSSGCDASPYFRIFNPFNQSEKFDSEGEFIKQYCPELKNLKKKFLHDPSKATPLELAEAGVTLGENYPFPVVDYKKQRVLALDMYKKGTAV